MAGTRAASRGSARPGSNAPPSPGPPWTRRSPCMSPARPLVPTATGPPTGDLKMPVCCPSGGRGAEGSDINCSYRRIHLAEISGHKIKRPHCAGDRPPVKPARARPPLGRRTIAVRRPHQTVDTASENTWAAIDGPLRHKVHRGSKAAAEHDHVGSSRLMTPANARARRSA